MRVIVFFVIINTSLCINLFSLSEGNHIPVVSSLPHPNSTTANTSTSSTLPVPSSSSRKAIFSHFDPFQHIIGQFLKLFIDDPDILRVTKQTLSSLVYIYIALSIAGTFGVDTKAILSLLSISGLTLGLAFQSILGQTFAGLFLLLFCPFKRGWTITIDEFTGKVVSVDTRYTSEIKLKY
jgi:small-conductance mechanosensitive channel